jgi:hypothetical protein
MDSIGLSLVVGGAALVVSGLTFLLPKVSRRSLERATTDESLETINHYLNEIRRQRNDYAERLLSGSMR